MIDHEKIQDLMRRGSPYLPVAVDVALRAEVNALLQSHRRLRERLAAHVKACPECQGEGRITVGQLAYECSGCKSDREALR